jgi:hypothetical protein
VNVQVDALVHANGESLGFARLSADLDVSARKDSYSMLTANVFLKRNVQLALLLWIVSLQRIANSSILSLIPTDVKLLVER